MTAAEIARSRALTGARRMVLRAVAAGAVVQSRNALYQFRSYTRVKGRLVKVTQQTTWLREQGLIQLAEGTSPTRRPWGITPLGAEVLKLIGGAS